MGIVTCEDLRGQVEVVLFPKTLDRYQAELSLESLVFFKGQVDRRREEPSLRVNEVIPLERADEMLSSMVLIRIQAGANAESTLKEIRETIAKRPGDRPVYLELWTSRQLKVTIRTNNRSSVKPTPEFLAAIESIVGPNNITTLGPLRRPAPTQQRSVVPPGQSPWAEHGSDQQSALYPEESDEDLRAPDVEAVVAG